MTDKYERERLMNLIQRTLPEEVDQWIEDVCLKDHHYMFYDKSSHQTYCSHCKKMIDQRLLVAEIAKHNVKGLCPECNYEIIYVCTGRFKHNCMKYDEFQIRVMQNTGEGIVIRRFEIQRRLCRDAFKWVIPELRWCELQRMFNNGNQSKNYRHMWYWNGPDSWNESRKTDYTTKSSMGYSTEIESFDFTQNVNDVLKSGPLKYSSREKDFSYYAGWRPQCEYLEKAGMKWLVNDLVDGKRLGLNFTATTIEKFLRIPKEYLLLVKQGNLNVYELCNLRWLLKENIRNFSVSTVRSLGDLKQIFLATQKYNRNIKLKEFLKYADKNPQIRQYGYYIDYLKFCSDLNYDFTDLAVIFPPDLTEAHDREMARVNMHKNKIISEKIEKRHLFDMKKHGFASNSLLIRPPKDSEEIINEGAALHHCVGTYVDKVANKETTILFIRLHSDPDKPFYTVEWNNNRTCQIRGDKNTPPTPEVATFIRQWESRNRKQKVRIQVAV